MLQLTFGSDPAHAGVPGYHRRALVGPLLEGRVAWLGYAVALVLPVLATLLRLALVPLLGSGSPLLPFSLTTLIVAILAGPRAAWLAAGISVPCAAVIALTGYANVISWQWAAHLAFFVISAVFMILVTDGAQRTYARQRRLLDASCEAESAARRAAEQMRLIADSVPALIAYVDRNHVYQFNNRQYQEWFAGPGPTGKHAREVLGEHAYAAVLPRMRQALAGQAVQFEAAVPYRDRGLRHISAHYVPDIDAQGVVRGYFSLIEDITERRRAADELQQAHERLSLAQRAGRAGTFEWHIADNVHCWSEELLEMHGFQPGEFGGTHQAWLASIHPEDRDRMVASAAHTLQEGELTVDYRIRRHDTGEVRWLHARGKVERDSTGLPWRLLGVNVDITERVQAETALHVASRRKDEFLAMLAHELRNPLAPIRSAVELLTQHAHDAQHVHAVGEMLDRQSGLLVRMVDDLLDVARITRGHIELRRSVMTLDTAVEAALESVRPLLARKAQTLEVQRWPLPLLVEADGARLSQVFANLLTNASRYSPEGTAIHITVREHGERIEVSVRDEGEGIDAQLLPHVFDLFTQGERSLARSQGGLGLGLTLVKYLVNMHGGTVEARSAGCDMGSEFVVHLPRVLHAAAAVLPAQEALESAGDPCRVLIVDDNRDAAEMLAMVLQLEGHDVRVAGDGNTALEMLEQAPAQVVLLDIGLPDLDGYQVARLLRARHGQALRLYAVTGYGREEDAELARHSGFDGHLTKPCEASRILQLLAAVPR